MFNEHLKFTLGLDFLKYASPQEVGVQFDWNHVKQSLSPHEERPMLRGSII